MNLRHLILTSILMPLMEFINEIRNKKISFKSKRKLLFPLVFFFITGGLLGNSIDNSQRVLLPMELLIIGYDKKINESGDDLIMLRNLVDLSTDDFFELSNSEYNSDGTWDRSFNDFISYGFRYLGVETVEKNSILVVKTNSLQGGQNDHLSISINGIDFSNDFEIIKNAQPGNTSNDLLKLDQEGEIYLHQGNWYTDNGSTKFLGTVVHGIIFSQNTLTPAFEGNVNLTIVDSNRGRSDIEDCDPCITKEVIKEPNNWDTGVGTSGIDINESPSIGPAFCECEGSLNIENDDCLVYVSLRSTFDCDESISYEWIQTDGAGGEVVIFSDLLYGPISSIMPVLLNSSEMVFLRITCGDCTKESNVIQVDCRGEERDSKNDEKGRNDEFLVYPNPTKNSFSIEIERPGNENINILIFSNNGLKLFERPYLSKQGVNKYSIDSSAFPSGVYFIQLKSGSTSLGWSYVTIIN